MINRCREASGSYKNGKPLLAKFAGQNRPCFVVFKKLVFLHSFESGSGIETEGCLWRSSF
jgi:hypothetical protein